MIDPPSPVIIAAVAAESKPWFQSKTVWFNIVSMAVTVAALLADPGVVSDPRVVGIAAAVVTVGNMALRVITAVPITGTPAASVSAVTPEV